VLRREIFALEDLLHPTRGETSSGTYLGAGRTLGGRCPNELNEFRIEIVHDSPLARDPGREPFQILQLFHDLREYECSAASSTTAGAHRRILSSRFI
jgi:hypothetical protein